MQTRDLSLVAYFFISTFSFAQSTGYGEMYLNTVSNQRLLEFTDFKPNEMRCMAEANVGRVECVHSEGNKIKKIDYTLNEAGRPLEVHRDRQSLAFTYLDDTLVRSILSKGKKTISTQISYEEGRITSREATMDKRTISRLLVRYNAEGNVEFSLLQQGRNLKNSYGLTNEYNDGEILRQKYTQNGKVFREWDYSCQPEGQVEHTKVVGEICTHREENADGSFVRHIRKMNGKYLHLYAHHFTRDSVLLKSEAWREDGSISVRSEYSALSKSEISYSKTGAVVREHRFEFDVHGNLLESKVTNRRGRARIARFKYDAQQLLTRREYLRNEKLKSSYAYTYHSR